LASPAAGGKKGKHRRAYPAVRAAPSRGKERRNTEYGLQKKLEKKTPNYKKRKGGDNFDREI